MAANEPELSIRAGRMNFHPPLVFYSEQDQPLRRKGRLGLIEVRPQPRPRRRSVFLQALIDSFLCGQLLPDHAERGLEPCAE